MGRSGVVLAMVVLLGGCASVQPISGGEQDVKAPALIHARPPDRSTSFNARAILLEFDERIQLDRVRERMLVSPPLDTAPDVRLVGPTRLEVRLNAPLAPNTTYTFNLGESVKDLTEGNIAAGLSYVVSTGHTVDSGMVAGAVTNAFTGSAAKGILVGLYAAGDTSAFRTGRPAYMTRTDAAGRFTIGNLPQGRFSVMALQDKNGNYRYDLPNEEIAFLDGDHVLITSDSSAAPVDLRVFLPVSARQQVRAYTVTADGALEVVFAKGVDSVRVRDVGREGGSLSWTPEYSTTQDTVLLWPSDTTLLASGRYEIQAGSEVVDTLGYRPTRKRPFHTGLAAQLIEGNEGAFIVLRSSRPIAKWDSTRISLRSDSADVPYRIGRKGLRSLALEFEARDGMPLRLLVGPKAVHDIHGGVNDSLRVSLGAAMERSTGTLEVNLSGLDPTRRYILQLLEGQQRVQQEVRVVAADPVVQWKLLSPGMRDLRLIEDMNGNGRWDPGEWATLKQPERTWYHTGSVNIRAAWEVKVDWPIDGR